MAEQKQMEIVREIVDNTKYQCKFVHNSRLGFYRYDKGIYVEDYEADWLHNHLRNIHPNTEPAVLDKVVQIVKEESYIKEEDFVNNKDIIALANCNYNLKTGETSEFDPNVINMSRIPAKYDPAATCPEFDKYLRTTIEPADIPLAEELIGFILTNKYDYKYLFILFGGIDGGKGTFIKLLTYLVGGNISSVPPHILAKDPFAAAELHNRSINTCGDISAKPIPDTSILKQLLGDDPIYGNKKHKSQFTFYNTAKMIFAANAMPSIKNDDELDIFVQKIKIITFPHSFPKAEQDHSLFSKMTTPSELSGILNKALAGLKRLREKNDFSNPLTPEEAKEKFLAKGNTVMRFIKDVVEISVTDNTIKEDVQYAFTEYCKLKKIVYARTTDSFWKSFKTSLPKEVDYNRQIKVKGEKKYAIGGIRLRNLAEIETTENQVMKIEPIKIEVPNIPETNSSYGFDEPCKLDEDYFEPLSEAEINLINDAIKEQKKQEEEADYWVEKHNKSKVPTPEQIDPSFYEYEAEDIEDPRIKEQEDQMKKLAEIKGD